MTKTSASAKPRRRVVITGFGMVTCLGGNVADTFAAARRGQSGLRKITLFDASNLPADVGGQVDDRHFAPEPDRPPYLNNLGYRAMDMMLAASKEAFEQSGLGGESAPDRVACMIGSHGEDPPIEQIQHVLRHADENGNPRLRELLRQGGYDFLQFYRRKPDVTASLVATHFNCSGPTQSVVSACAAGPQAIGEAYRCIRRNHADAALCGGADAKLNYAGYIGFVLLKALCERYKTPETASRPFDRRRAGFVMSEGAATLVIEELEHAKARNATILGEILGYGDSADAYRITDVHPRGEGAKAAMRMAMADAGVAPEQVQYVNAHGTSTKQNDKVESLAIREVFGDHADNLPVSSNKSMLGHAIAAAGAIEAILTIQGMRESVLLPTINYESPDPKCPLPDYVPNEARDLEHSVALSNSFGFGGQNACLCLAKYLDAPA